MAHKYCVRSEPERASDVANLALPGPVAPVVVAAAAPVTGLPRARHPVPEAVDIDRKVQNEGHRTVVTDALPYLKQVMLHETFCAKPPRDQVREALERVDSAGKRFWGVYYAYTRKRTVEDLVLNFYYDAVRAKL